MARQNDVKTLAAITGQPTEDVVAMLKQYNGDVNACDQRADGQCVPLEPRVFRSDRHEGKPMAVAGRLDFPA